MSQVRYMKLSINEDGEAKVHLEYPRQWQKRMKNITRKFVIGYIMTKHHTGIIGYQNISYNFKMFWSFNPFNPEFTIVIFIHYKPRIAVAILDL